jgi:uncharacterized phage-associated protein
VAKEFVKLALSGDEEDPLTNLRLQKLLYCAQAWSLILRDSELFADELQAWQHGPVVPTIYHQPPDGHGSNLLRLEAFADVPDLQGDEAEFVKRVWEAYNLYSALQLCKMTRQEMPWRKTWGDRPAHATGQDTISIGDLEDFFGKQPVPASLAAYREERRQKEEEAERQLAVLPPLDPARLTAASRSFTPGARGLTGEG